MAYIYLLNNKGEEIRLNVNGLLGCGLLHCIYIEKKPIEWNWKKNCKCLCIWGEQCTFFKRGQADLEGEAFWVQFLAAGYSSMIVYTLVFDTSPSLTISLDRSDGPGMPLSCQWPWLPPLRQQGILGRQWVSGTMFQVPPWPWRAWCWALSSKEQLNTLLFSPFSWISKEKRHKVPIVYYSLFLLLKKRVNVWSS